VERSPKSPPPPRPHYKKKGPPKKKKKREKEAKENLPQPPPQPFPKSKNPSKGLGTHVKANQGEEGWNHLSPSPSPPRRGEKKKGKSWKKEEPEYVECKKLGKKGEGFLTNFHKQKGGRGRGGKKRDTTKRGLVSPPPKNL